MNRRSFLRLAGTVSIGLLGGAACTRPAGGGGSTEAQQRDRPRPDASGPLTIFLCGDVMLGRGIDQILPHSVDPRLHERAVRSARDYVSLAEQKNGPIPRRVDCSYIWGDALEILEQIDPEARIVNLETAVTEGGEPWIGKGIHYRVHPKNAPCLTRAGFSCCALANNHVLDWGRAGLAETLAALRALRLATAGAGRDLEEAAAPARVPTRGGGRVLVFAFGHESSGIPREWAAGDDRAGVNLLGDLSERSVASVAERVHAVKRPGDVVVASIHWGGNWGYRVSDEQRRFARGLIARAGVDVLHGHSSHHPKGIEMFRGHPMLYGCGDFITDYEGIGGYEEFRNDLSLMYFLRLDRASGELRSLEMVPMQIRRFRLRRASPSDAQWLAETLDRACARLGGGVALSARDTLILR